VRRRPLPNALDIDLRGGLTEEVTPHAGSALLIELGRRSGVMAAAEKHLPARKSRKGLGHGQFVESFVLLSALGGDCLDDFDGLRRDRGLAALLGYDLPAAATARPWLDRFHEPERLEPRPAQGSFIPLESSWLAGLRAVVRHAVHAYVTSQAPGPEVTLDVDAHLVESAKREALPTSEGYRGYQPLLVSWAETGLVLADEFRDGNVPAAVHIQELVDEAYASLPAGAWRVAVRSDSAGDQQEALDHWQERGWRFAVSADMSPQLRAAVEALVHDAWQPWQPETNGTVREWAEVPFVPSRRQETRDAVPYRYVAIRIRAPQGLLFANGSRVKHFAVVTNDWDTDGQALLEWQRGKAGTIEQVNRVLKDELAAGVYPSGKFGANATWLRLQVLTLNLLELLKAAALDPELRRARPKRLRFTVFTQFGRVVHHARAQFMRLGTPVLNALFRPAWERLRGAPWPAAA
jgi:hypothetical protein